MTNNNPVYITDKWYRFKYYKNAIILKGERFKNVSQWEFSQFYFILLTWSIIYIFYSGQYLTDNLETIIIH